MKQQCEFLLIICNNRGIDAAEVPHSIRVIHYPYEPHPREFYPDILHLGVRETDDRIRIHVMTTIDAITEKDIERMKRLLDWMLDHDRDFKSILYYQNELHLIALRRYTRTEES